MADATADLRSRVDPDDHVCLCFHVSLRKIRTFLARENPPVASLISECLSAGTGCMWCVPFLKHLHAQHLRGETPDLKVSPEKYVSDRASYRESGSRPAGSGPADDSGGPSGRGKADPGAPPPE